MRIKNLFFDTSLILGIITLLVVVVNTFQVHLNAEQDLRYLQRQYLNDTYETYKKELTNDIHASQPEIEQPLLNKISQERGVGVFLTYNGKVLTARKYKNETPLIHYQLKFGNKEYAKLTLYPTKAIRTANLFNELFIPLSVEILVLLAGLIFLLRRIRRKLLNPLKELFENLEPDKIQKFRPSNEAVYEVVQLSKTLKKLQKETQKKAQLEAESIATKQVAHDIRSPLACLNLLLSCATALPEKQRVMMRSSVQRITDIANTLQSKATQIDKQKSNRPAADAEQVSERMISSLVGSVVTEKRVQLGTTSNIRIDLNIERCYGLFAHVNSTELKRALSNLIDNCLEAFDAGRHSIHVVLDQADEKILIRIEDDGKGIPKDILCRIGTYGFSYGKDNTTGAGSGTGVYHAIQTIKSFGGEFQIESIVGKGTTVCITLPKCPSPCWFVSSINLTGIQSVVILDDDESIHLLWDDKFEKLGQRRPQHILHFEHVDQFNDFMSQKLGQDLAGTLFLIDFELLGQKVTGLDLIQQHKLARQAILVTSHHNDVRIKTATQKICLRVIPKGVAPYVPFTP